MAAKALSPREREVLEGVVEILKKNLEPNTIILFGSRAKGTARETADFDLAVDAERPELRQERKILEQIDEVSGLYSVDVVYLGSVDEEFKDIILKNGQVVYERRN